MLERCTQFTENLFSNSREVKLDQIEELLKEVWPAKLGDQEGEAAERVSKQLDSEFTIEEVRTALNQLKNHKAPGNDGIPAEVYKFIFTAESLEAWRTFFNTCIHEGDVPSQLKESIITLLHKKGVSTICDNYRTISLLSTLTKWLTKMLNNRLSAYVELHGGHSCLGLGLHYFVPSFGVCRKELPSSKFT